MKKMIMKNFRLILSEPGKEDIILVSGDENYCETKRLEYSASKYNSAFLRIEEVKSSLICEDTKLVEKFSWKGIISMVVLAAIGFIFGKEEKKK